MKYYLFWIWILALVVWIVALFVLVAALTINSPENPFYSYRLIIGIGFISYTGFLRIWYKKRIRQLHL